MIGIIGGMGPRASAAFLNTIYAYAQGDERHAPSVILNSVSGAPDRNAAIAGQGEKDLVSHIQRAGDVLLDAGVQSVIIACVTAHAFIPRLSLALQKRIISLVDVALRQIEKRSNSALMLCSEGSRRARLFESHQLWPAVRHKVTLPTQRHQRRVDEMIGSIKSHGISAREVGQCRRLLNDYGVDGFISACTEFHLLNPRFAGPVPWSKETVVDPLEILAVNMGRNPVLGRRQLVQ